MSGDDFKRVFDKTYPSTGQEPARMPFQGAWPIDFWALEATAFGLHPELWWPGEPECACGKEAQMSYRGKYYCRNCFHKAATGESKS